MMRYRTKGGLGLPLFMLLQTFTLEIGGLFILAAKQPTN